MNALRWCVVALLVASAARLPAAERPNIVVILADDLGYGDVKALNPQGKIATDHIDRLAREGVTMTDAHSGSSVCSPTRYGLLTGRYAWRTRLVKGVLGPYDKPLIEDNRLTIPKLLKPLGYHSACIGKWHLGWDWPRKGDADPDFTMPIPGGPTSRGFDYYFGTDVPNYPPYCFLENDRTVGQPTDQKKTRNLDGRPGPMLPGWQFDAILPKLAERASQYVAERAAEKKPFFLYFPLTSPHEPISPSEQFRGKSGINAWADFLLETDWAVGQVLAAIDKAGIADNTLVLFTSDNGHSTYTGLKELQDAGHEPSGALRGFKGNIHEGGHRVPYFVRWPGKIKPGSKSAETICHTDLLTTIASIVQARVPDNAGEDSHNVLPAWLGQKLDHPIREATVHQAANGQLAVRQGTWKLVLREPPAAPPPGKKPLVEIKPPPAPEAVPDEVQLFDLAKDLAETTNVAAANAEVVDRLAKLLDKYRRENRSSPVFRLPGEPRFHAGDRTRPRPRVVEPGTASTPEQPGRPPADAVVLFDGQDLSQWAGKKVGNADPAEWKVENGYFEIAPGKGSIYSRAKFRDAQIHIEWAAPAVVKGNDQGRGNSGVYLGSFGEVQVLDSFNNDTYPDGQAAALYGKSPPLVNAARRPGEWQTYDILVQLAKVDEKGQITRPARLTVLHNGVVAHHAFEFPGKPGEFQISLQDHGNPVRYRNVWVRRIGEYDEETK